MLLASRRGFADFVACRAEQQHHSDEEDRLSVVSTNWSRSGRWECTHTRNFIGVVRPIVVSTMVVSGVVPVVVASVVISRVVIIRIIIVGIVIGDRVDAGSRAITV